MCCQDEDAGHLHAIIKNEQTDVIIREGENEQIVAE